MGVTEDAAAVVATGTTINETVNDYFQQLLDRGNAGIVAVEAEYQSRIASMKTVSFINKTTGDDAADGSATAPFKTVQAALDKTPRGGYCVAILQADYHVDIDIRVEQKRLLLKSDSTVKHRITYERFPLNYNSNVYTAGAGFIPIGNPSIVVSGLILDIPGSENIYGTYIKNQGGCLFKQGEFEVTEAYQIMLIGCEVDIPVDAYCPLFANTFNPLSLSIFNTTFTNQPPSGNLIWGVNDSAGTDAASVPLIMTNLNFV